MASDKGNDDAMNKYANIMDKGDGVKANKINAIRYYKMAIEKK